MKYDIFKGLKLYLTLQTLIEIYVNPPFFYLSNQHNFIRFTKKFISSKKKC
jgi:hypothetical protein